MLRMHMTIAIPSHLSDGALIAEVARYARDERHATAQLVAHLAELDARRLYLGAGKSSLFKYCCDVLGLSDDAAYTGSRRRARVGCFRRSSSGSSMDR